MEKTIKTEQEWKKCRRWWGEIKKIINWREIMERKEAMEIIFKMLKKYKLTAEEKVP